MAKDWGLLPSQWDALSEYDQAEIMGYETVVGEMSAYEDFQAEEKRVRNEALQSVKG